MSGSCNGLSTWFLVVLSNLSYFQRPLQDNLHHKLGGFYVGNDALELQECTSYFINKWLVGHFKDYLDNFMKLFLDDFTTVSKLALIQA